MGKWKVQETEYTQHIQSILDFLLEEYKKLFGYDIMSNTDCVAYVDLQATCPMFIGCDLPNRVRLAQAKKNDYYFSNIIFQLSHEMCHYAFHQRKEDKNFILYWFEEIVCEAMALYALDYAGNNWHDCALSSTYPMSSRYHEIILRSELKNKATDIFKQCDSVEKLREYEKQGLAGKQRESHVHERNFVYRAIKDNPLDLKYVANYAKYVGNDGVTIDFDRWIRDCPSMLLVNLKSIQPVKL